MSETKSLVYINDKQNMQSDVKNVVYNNDFDVNNYYTFASANQFADKLPHEAIRSLKISHKWKSRGGWREPYKNLFAISPVMFF